MLPLTAGAVCCSRHRIGDNFFCTNGYSATDSLIKRMKNKDSGVRNMDEWSTRAFKFRIEFDDLVSENVFGAELKKRHEIVDCEDSHVLHVS